MDYGLLGGLGEGLQKGVAAYIEGRKLKKSEEQDAEKMALARRESKLKELEIAGKLMEAGVDIPKGMFSAETESAITGSVEQTPTGAPQATPDASQMAQPSVTQPQTSMGFLSPPAGFKTKKVKEAEKQLPQLQLSAMDKGLEPYIDEKGDTKFRPISSKTPEAMRKQKKEELEIATKERELAEKSISPEIAVQIRDLSSGLAKQATSQSQLNQLFKQTTNEKMPKGDRVNIALEQLKLLNSTLGADAVGAEEVGRMAGALSMWPNPQIGKLTPGPDLEMFNRQVKASIDRVTGTIRDTQKNITNIKSGKGLLGDAQPSLPPAPKRPQGLLPEAEASKTEFVIMSKPGQKPLRVPLSDVDDAKREGWTPKGAK